MDMHACREGGMHEGGKARRPYVGDELTVLDDLSRPAHGDHTLVDEDNAGDFGIFNARQGVQALSVGTVPDLQEIVEETRRRRKSYFDNAIARASGQLSTGPIDGDARDLLAVVSVENHVSLSAGLEVPRANARVVRTGDQLQSQEKCTTMQQPSKDLSHVFQFGIVDGAADRRGVRFDHIPVFRCILS